MEFSDHLRAAPGATFSDWVRSEAGSLWDRMVEHRFTQDVATDTLPAEVWRRYLLCEHAFVETAVTIFGYALVKAPAIAEQTRLAAILRALTIDQLEYFDRVLGRLGVTPEERQAFASPATALAFRDGMLALAAHGTYEEIIGGMTAAEWMYHTWCVRAHERRPSDPIMLEWVALHAATEFTDQVLWLRGQLDRYGPELAPRRQTAVAEAFRHTLALEIGFHDAPYLDGAAGKDPSNEGSSR